MQTERLVALARQHLVVAVDESTNDLWLWEHGERVLSTARMLAEAPDTTSGPVDAEALTAAALFHDAGWIVEYQQGKWKRWQLLSRPTNDIQRELGAALLQEEAGSIVSPQSMRTACEAIRLCNDRETEQPEACLIAEAEALDDVAAVYLLRQFRQYRAEGRPLLQLVESWQRQKEYHFWDLRLNDGFRWDFTRKLARERLAAVDAYLVALGTQLQGDDLAVLLGASEPAPVDSD